MNSVGYLTNPMSNEELLRIYTTDSQKNIELYRARCEQTRKDTAEFDELGTKFSEAALKISAIINKFGEKYKGNPDGITIDVAADGNFRVELEPLSFSLHPCPMCDHKETGGKVYQITNLDTQATLTCHGISFHGLTMHHYLAWADSEYRLEPSRVCKLFEKK